MLQRFLNLIFVIVVLSWGTGHSFERGSEPVVVSGAGLSSLYGLPVDELFLYAWRGNSWVQIPYQVDEVTPDGSYFDDDDGLLDANDEIVFLAADLGDIAEADNWLPNCSDQRYEMQVSDPLNPSESGYVYLYHSAELSQDTTDYVSCIGNEIVSDCYLMGSVDGSPHINDAIIIRTGGGGDNTDLLDRVKIRALVDLPWPFPDTTLTEEDFGSYVDGLKDGRVRVIRQLGSIFLGDSSASAMTFHYRAYMETGSPSRQTASRSKQFEFEIVYVRYTTDFNQEISGLVHYDNSGPAGNGPVYVDGIADAVETVPVGVWWEVDHPTSGCVVAVTQLSSIPGTISMFYQDGGADPSGRDTGEDGLWGETGVYVDQPGDTADVEISGCTFILSSDQGNVGEAYAERFFNPLVVGPVLQEAPIPITFIRGDVDGDMEISMSDGTFILKHLYVPGSPVPDCMDSADVNDDGTIEMNDVVYLLKNLYVPGSPPIPEPSSQCGEDSTLDDLDCVQHPCMDDSVFLKRGSERSGAN